MQQECLQCVSPETFDAKTILALISAITALAATTIGPIVAYKIAMRQIRVSTDATERREWLQSFRDDIALFLTKAEILRVHVQDPTNSKVKEKAQSSVEDVNVLFRKIGLRLDPNVPTHLEVLNLLQQVLVYLTNPSSISSVDFINLTRRVNDQARQLIHIELDEIRGVESKRIITRYKPKH